MATKAPQRGRRLVSQAKHRRMSFPNFFDLPVSGHAGSNQSYPVPMNPSPPVPPPAPVPAPPQPQLEVLPRAPGTVSGSEETGDKKPKERKRARVVLSCTACVRRKTKCDKVVPCSTCVKRGESAVCFVEDLKEDATRQPFALNDDLVELRSRVATLEALVASLIKSNANGNGNPPTSRAGPSTSPYDYVIPSSALPPYATDGSSGGLPVANGAREQAREGGAAGSGATGNAGGSEEEGVAAVLQMLGGP